MKELIKQKLNVESMSQAEVRLNLARNTLNSWFSNNTINAKVEIALLKLGLKEDERLKNRIEKLKIDYKNKKLYKESYERSMQNIKALLEEIEAV